MDISIICVDTLNKEKALKVITEMTRIFPCKEALFFTNNVQSNDVDIIEIPTIKNTMEYSVFILQEIPKYIKTEHTLIVQHDGYIINPSKWRNEFLEWDYIGAPWSREQQIDHNATDKNAVGNGGFSLRSKKFWNACQEIFQGEINGLCEDIECCIDRRNEFDKRNIKFAPLDIAFKFSLEDCDPEEYNLIYEKPFGFHNKDRLISEIENGSFEQPKKKNKFWNLFNK